MGFSFLIFWLFVCVIICEEYILQYKKWLNKKQRLKIINEQFPLAKINHMEDFSDFDTIHLNCNNKNVIYNNRTKLSSEIRRFIQNKVLVQTKPMSYSTLSSDKPNDITKLLNANYIWSLGFTGQNVKVAVVDTGLNENQKFLRNLKEQINFTNESIIYDNHGHGTVITSIIANMNKKCLDFHNCIGLAPDVDMYALRTFNKHLKSHTSWFLKAFNFILRNKIHVVNLSLGSADFTDAIFVEKIQELVSNNIIVVSAAGNNGPIFGTVHNPADQIEVIGVGSCSQLSSRGITTMELPEGMGRLKPDLVTYGDNVPGLNINNGFISIGGSSVASAIATGSIALLLSSKIKNWNVAFVKQALMSSADRINQLDEFHQGVGQLNLVKAFEWFRNKNFQVTLSPSSIDFFDCPYKWINCIQPLYYSAMPYVTNVTIINSLNKTFSITKVSWKSNEFEFNDYLNVSCKYDQYFQNWHGFISVYLSANKNWQGIITGKLQIQINSKYDVFLPIKIKLIETPPRLKRLLWDQYHNLPYPKHCAISDDLRNLDKQPVDWIGDHIYTNFRQLFNHLRANSYYLEILNDQFTSFNASNYGALLIIDPERDFSNDEMIKLQNDINVHNLSLIIFADWYNPDLLEEFDVFQKQDFLNCKQASVMGSNLNSLNALLMNWSIELSSDVYFGDVPIRNYRINYMSGTSLKRFPINNSIIYSTELTKIYMNEKEVVNILGLYENKNRGKIAIFGDSNCLDETFNHESNCYWILDAFLQYVLFGHTSTIFQTNPTNFINQIFSTLLDVLVIDVVSLDFSLRDIFWNGLMNVICVEFVSKNKNITNPFLKQFFWNHLQNLNTVVFYSHFRYNLLYALNLEKYILFDDK